MIVACYDWTVAAKGSNGRVNRGDLNRIVLEGLRERSVLTRACDLASPAVVDNQEKPHAFLRNWTVVNPSHTQMSKLFVFHDTTSRRINSKLARTYSILYLLCVACYG
jgi:hypothetical protein